MRCCTLNLDYYTRKYGIAIIVALAVVAFILPLIIRASQGAPITPGTQSYQYLEYTEQGRVFFEPYVLLLLFVSLFGVPWLLPFLLMMLFLALLYYYLDDIVQSKIVLTFAFLFLLVSPTISVLATSHSSLLLSFVFVLCVFLSIEKYSVFAAIMLLLTIVSSPIVGILLALWIIVLSVRQHHFSMVVVASLFCILGIVWVVSSGAILFSFQQTQWFFELGNIEGVSIFLMILAAYGLIAKFSKRPLIMFGSCIMFGAIFFINELAFAATIVVAIFAAYGMYDLLTNRWELELLQRSLHMLVICICLFLLIVTIKERVVQSPTEDFSHMMITLRNQQREGAVLSAPEYAPSIRYFSHRDAVLAPNADESILSKAFYSRNPSVVYGFLSSTNTVYILVTDEMRDLYFTRSDEGILFLLENSGRFVKIAETQTTELWYFIRTT